MHRDRLSALGTESSNDFLNYVEYVTSPSYSAKENRYDKYYPGSCDGKELKPKSGAKNSDTWILDGRELKLKYGASFSNTWIWDGKEIRPKTGGSYANTWVIEGQKVKPKINANSSNTYDMGNAPILAVFGQLILRLW